MVHEYVDQYLSAQSKSEKSQVILAIISKIRKESPTGSGLVKQDTKTLRWSYIGNEKAKDKIGHALRKAAQDCRRKRANQAYSQSYQHLSHSSSYMSLESVVSQEVLQDASAVHHNAAAAAATYYHHYPGYGYHYALHQTEDEEEDNENTPPTTSHDNPNACYQSHLYASYYAAAYPQAATSTYYPYYYHDPSTHSDQAQHASSSPTSSSASSSSSTASPPAAPPPTTDKGLVPILPKSDVSLYAPYSHPYSDAYRR